MAEIHVRKGAGGAGSSLPSLSAAAAVARAGDTVIVHEGVYRERLTPPRGTTWQAAEGETVVIDGGWDGKTDVGGNQAAMIAIAAADVVIDGFRVVNAPGDAITVGKGGHNAAILNCLTDVAYSGGIICNAGETLRGVTIDGCTVLRSGMGWVARGRKGGVSGAINLIRCDGATVRDTVSAYNWGEGCNVGKGTKNSVIRANVIYDNAHFCLGVNHAQDCTIEANLLFLTGFEPRQVGGENWPTGLTIGDEIGYGGDAFPPSRGIIVRGNIIINCGSGIGVRNGAGWDAYDTQLVDSIIEHNTVVAGPCTRVCVNIGVNGRGRPHKNSTVRANVIETSGATWPGFEAATGDTANVEWRANAWTEAPAAGFRHAEDVVGFTLANATAALANEFPEAGHSLELGNYRPLSGGPVALAGIGALGPDGPNRLCSWPALAAPPDAPRYPARRCRGGGVAAPRPCPRRRGGGGVRTPHPARRPAHIPSTRRASSLEWPVGRLSSRTQTTPTSRPTWRHSNPGHCVAALPMRGRRAGSRASHPALGDRVPKRANRRDRRLHPGRPGGHARSWLSGRQGR